MKTVRWVQIPVKLLWLYRVHTFQYICYTFLFSRTVADGRQYCQSRLCSIGADDADTQITDSTQAWGRVQGIRAEDLVGAHRGMDVDA